MSAPTEKSSVFVRGIGVDAHIGVHDHEKEARQPLIIDVEIELASDHRFGGDKISGTINYETIVAKATEIANNGHVALVETFAEQLAQACLEDRLAIAVRVRIEKPRALPSAKAAGVEITRRKTLRRD